MLSNQGFISKAPKEKIQEETEKLEQYKQMLNTARIRQEELNK